VEDRALQELRVLRAQVERALGMRSRWNGVLLLDDTMVFAHALFRADGSIAMRPDLVSRRIRWRVYIHELVHSVAAPLEQGQYETNIGWEEGPVEALQRLIRPEVMREAGFEYDTNLIRRVEAVWAYEPYVEAVERIRRLTGGEERSFYSDLLRHPVQDRAGLLIRQQLNLGRIEIARQIAAGSAQLRARIQATPRRPELALPEEAEDA
jgi:hypothetical protein